MVTVCRRPDRGGDGSPGTSTQVSMFQPAGDAGLAGHLVSAMPFSPGAGATTSSARDRLAALALADNDGADRIDLIAVAADRTRRVDAACRQARVGRQNVVDGAVEYKFPVLNPQRRVHMWAISLVNG